jgi:type IV secretion system protein VirB10
VSRRVGIALTIVAALILGLFAYGGFKRQQRQESVLRSANTPQNVGPATSLGAEIAKEQQTARSEQPELAPGALQPPNDPALPPVVVRQGPYQSPPPAPAPPPQIPEPSPEQRRIIAAYEREQQAISAPTTPRDSVGGSAASLAAPTTGESPLEGLAQALRRQNSAGVAAATNADSDQNAQGDKEAFVANARKAQIEDYLKSTRMPPLSRFEIKAGWEIPAILEQALNSDLPGEIEFAPLIWPTSLL